MPRQGGRKRTEIDLKFERTRRRYDLVKWTISPAVWLVACWVPLQVACWVPLQVATKFSGHKTTITVSITITLVVSIAGGEP